jgi:hypothetical protein
MSRPGIIRATIAAMTIATIIQGGTNQNFRVLPSVASEGKGRASRPSIFMNAGAGTSLARRSDTFSLQCI